MPGLVCGGLNVLEEYVAGVGMLCFRFGSGRCVGCGISLLNPILEPGGTGMAVCTREFCWESLHSVKLMPALGMGSALLLRCAACDKASQW